MQINWCNRCIAIGVQRWQLHPDPDARGAQMRHPYYKWPMVDGVGGCSKFCIGDQYRIMDTHVDFISPIAKMTNGYLCLDEQMRFLIRLDVVLEVRSSAVALVGRSVGSPIRDAHPFCSADSTRRIRNMLRNLQT